MRRDFELRSKRTFLLLVLAGAVGVAGALGGTWLVADHPFSHHASWSVAAFSTLWAGLLVVSLALGLLRVRTQSFPLARAALLGLIGLGIAGAFGTACPDPHFLVWWTSTRFRDQLATTAGLHGSALCLGVVATFLFAAMAAVLASGTEGTTAFASILPAVMLLLLLSPAIALQSVGLPLRVGVFWLVGTAVGSLFGVTAGMHVRKAIHG
ncbi:MAG: hypothetical protein DCC71_03680 [Proteobacteria bacterium]|nr:MAG: hypothetical protein DCC71_03680 [Pseudomonadota bacterium]